MTTEIADVPFALAVLQMAVFVHPNRNRFLMSYRLPSNYLVKQE